jgi:hypothetical protein
MKSSTNTLNCLVVSSESTSEELVQVHSVPSIRGSIRNRRNIENAIYAYIRAIRALGRKNINTVEIAEALSLPIAAVDLALTSLKKKGVKTLNV